MTASTTLSDQLPGLLARVRRAGLTGPRAETMALRILLQFHHRSGPDWLRGTDDRTRLDVLTALALHRGHGTRPATPDRTGTTRWS